ncbi:MAG: GNAT family N-acetyltransferase [Methylotenera sp.]|nr:GNAT family N-acetyltransferase [Oligoflexia bacterium]
MTNPIHFRQGQKTDQSVIVEFQTRMALETEGLRLDPPTVSLGVQAVLEDAHKGVYWIAESPSEPRQVIAVLLTIPEWSDWRNGTVVWIHSLYVLPNFRKSGVFRQMYDQLKAKVQADPGLKGIRLYVDRGNHAAQKVYESLEMNSDHYHLYEWLK